LPLEAPATDGREGYDVTNFVAGTDTRSPFDAAAQSAIKERVEYVLRELNPREETVVRMRFGIGREAARTLAEIGEWLSLSRERVRQIEQGALAKIKASLLGHELAELFGAGDRFVPSTGTGG
jgi:RNA polymerase primary sigma factor